MDELYFEEGYVEVGYFAKTLIGAAALSSSASLAFDGDIADTSGYYIPDYIDVGYFENGVVVTGSGSFSASATISVTVTKIVQGSSTITDAFSATMTVNAIRFVDSLMEMVSTFSATANKTVDPGATLANIANLDAQANKIFAFAAAAAAEFNLTAEFTNVQFADSTMSSDFTLSASAISYIRKSNLPNSTTSRPWATSYISQNLATEQAPVFDSVTKKFGSHSLRFYQDDGGVNPTQNSYVKYYSSADVARMPQLGQALHIEFWARNTGQFVDAREGTTSRWRINSSGLTVAGGPSIAFTLTAGQFNHIVVKAQPSNIKVYINGSLAGSSTNSFPANGIDNIVFGDDDLYGTNFPDGFFYLDEFRIIRGSIADVDADVGYTISASSITEPTQEFDSTANTKLLLHWNNSYVDDIYGVQVAASSLASQFSQVTSATQQALFSAAFSSEFALSTTTSIIRTTNATINSEFAQSTTPDYLRNASAALTSSFAVTAEPSITRTSQVSLSSEFAQTSTVVKTVDPDIEFAAVASQLTAAAKIGDFLISADVVASLNLDAVKTAIGNANLASEFTQTIEAFKGVVGSGDLNSVSSIAADVVKITDTNAVVESTSSVDAVVNKIADGVVDISAVSQLSADPAGTIITITSDLFSTATVSAVVSRIQQGTAALADQFAVTAVPFAGIVGSSNITSVVELSADADRIRNVRIGYAGDRIAKTISTYGNVEISTAQSKFGSGSALITDTGDYFTVPGDSSLYNSNFTVEMWLYASNLTSIPNGNIWDNRTSSSNGMYLYVSYGSIGLGEGINIKGLISAGFNNNQWNHIALVRNGTNAKVFVNGVQKISATVTTINYSNRTSYIGSTYTGSTPMRCYFDEVRLSSSARYTTGFTPLTTAFTSDGDVRALLHLDTDFGDDVGYAPGLQAFVSTLTAAVTIGEFFINADVAATFNIEPVVLAAGSVAAEAITNVSADVVKTAAGIVELETVATFSAEGTSNIIGEGTFEINTSLVVDSVVIADSAAALITQSHISISPTKTVDPGSDFSAATTLSITGERTRSSAADLDSVITASASAGILASAVADLPSITTALIIARELRIDQYVYLIPSETRTHSIQRETRSHTIRYETRTHAIEGT